MGRNAGGGGRKPVRSISVTSGRLTTTERRSITAILNQGLTGGRVGRTDYSLSGSGDNYTVRISRMDRGMGWIGEPLRRSTSTSSFTVTR